MRSVHYLQRGVDVNHCFLYNDYYTYEGEPDLSRNTAQVKFTSPSKAYPDLTMSFSLLDRHNTETDAVLNIQWTYSDQSKKKPFEVPNSIINNRDILDTKAKLSDFISLDKNTGVAMITIKKNGVEHYQLEGFLMSN